MNSTCWLFTFKLYSNITNKNTPKLRACDFLYLLFNMDTIQYTM